MTTSPSKVQLLEVGQNEAKVYAPMTQRELADFVAVKFGHQPVSYFNRDRRLYVITLGAVPEIRPLSVRVEI
jgi:hypothetical protein